MKVINYDFENIGGVLQVFAVPPTSFSSILEDHMNGLFSVELRNKKNIISIPVYANDTYSFDENKSVTDAGDTWNVSVEGVIPKLYSYNKKLIETLERGLWYVLAVDNNGEVHWCGQEEALMQFNTAKTSGQSVADRNGTTFTFSCVQDEPTIYIADIEDLQLVS